MHSLSLVVAPDGEEALFTKPMGCRLASKALSLLDGDGRCKIEKDFVAVVERRIH